jgi:hypothetical protein
MKDSLFYKLEIEAYRKGIPTRTDESLKWFRNRLKDMRNISRNTLLKDPALKQRQRFGVGNMYMYFYDPKHRETLPYYDAFPLTIMIGPAKGGFLGLNLHYLPLQLRAKLFDNLLKTTNNKHFNETTKFKVNYNMLQGAAKMKEFKPCIKHYLTTQVDSKIVLVEPPEWEIALFMPVEQFMKSSKNKVWKDSKSMI